MACTSLHKTRSGYLLVKLRCDADNTVNLTKAIVGAIGNPANFKILEQTMMLTMMDLDELVVKNEVLKVL